MNKLLAFSLVLATALALPAGLPSNYQRLSENIVLYWDFAPNDTVNFAVSYTKFKWIGIGFGKGMSDIDMVIIERPFDNDTYRVSDTWSEGTHRPDNDTKLGGHNDITNVTAIPSKEAHIVSFQRKMNTGDQYDQVLQKGTLGISWAGTVSKTIVFHGRVYSQVGTIDINFQDGVQVDTLPFTPFPLVFDLHRWYFYVFWGFLVDLPLIAIRHFKSNPNYVTYHGLVLGLASLFSLLPACYLMIHHLQLDLPVFSSLQQGIHCALGGAYIIIIVIQNALGLIAKAKKEGYQFDKNYQATRQTHRIIGYLTYLLGKGTVFAGTYIYLYDLTFQYVLVFWYPALLVIRAIIEFIFFKLKKRIPSVPGEVSEQPLTKLSKEQEALVSMIEAHKTKEEIRREYPDLKWAFFGTRILDLSDFNHPGGNFIIQQIIGREIGRFIYGAYPLEAYKMGSAHTHSLTAYDLMSEKYIGDVQFKDDNVLIPKTTLRDVLPRESSWRLVAKHQLSKTTARYHFVSEEYDIRNHVSGIRWFGRHFNITSIDSSTPKRQYTTCLAFAPQREEYRKALIQAYETVMTGGTANRQSLAVAASAPVPELCLHIKSYTHVQGFSAFVANAQDQGQTNFLIEGPIGEGMGLQAPLNDDHYVFCAGTGILPFLDFLNYYLEYLIYSVIGEQYDQPTADSVFNPHKETFDNAIGKKFRLIVAGAFRDGSEFIGKDVIEQIAAISKKYRRDQFEAFIHLGDNTECSNVRNIPGKIDNFFIKEFIKPDGARYFICGPPMFNQDVYQNLKTLGAPTQRLQFL